MLTWYQSKVKYDQLNGDKNKTVSEPYLHEAVNFGEVEKQCYEHLKKRIKDPNVDAIAKASFDEVIFYAGTTPDSFTADPFYRIVIESGDKRTYLIPAKDAEQAIERALKAHGYGDAHNVFEVKRTEILAVWHPKNELWMGDWHNRMDLLLEQKKHSWDINQSSLFDEAGNAKADPALNMQDLADKLNATITVGKKAGAKRQFNPNKKNIKFFNKNEEMAN
jgi:hypothetical protein